MVQGVSNYADHIEIFAIEHGLAPPGVTAPERANGRKRVLAVASSGGHWEQLQLMREAFEHHEVRYATTLQGLGERSGLTNVAIIPDCHRGKIFNMARCFVALLTLQLRLRPHIVITTGALPGLIAIAIGRKLGARTIWVDSIANAETMSMAGSSAQRHASLWLSQWPQVAEEAGATYAGSVL